MTAALRAAAKDVRFSGFHPPRVEALLALVESLPATAVLVDRATLERWRNFNSIDNVHDEIEALLKEPTK